MISYKNVSSFMLFCDIYCILVLEFMWFIQKKESVIFNFWAPILLRSRVVATVKVELKIYQVWYILDKKTWKYFSISLIKIRNNNTNVPNDYYNFSCYKNSLKFLIVGGGGGGKRGKLHFSDILHTHFHLLTPHP